MPFDEHGVKWSCEPCIRGHRSSKCAHFDRLMVSVGKAGRPLSKCPHVEGNCNCKKLCAFMVAIPKGTGCICRPVYKMLLNENGPTPAVSRLPPDLAAGAGVTASSGPSPSKVQKPGRKPARPAPEQVSRALNSVPEYHQRVIQTPTPAMSPYPPQEVQVAGYSYNANNGIFPHHNPFPAGNDFSNGLPLPHAISSASVGRPDNFQSPMQSYQPLAMQPRRSCCAKSRQESSSDIKVEPNAVAQNAFNTLPMAAPHMSEASSSTWQGYTGVDGHFSPVHGTSNGFQPTASGFEQHVSPKVYTGTAGLGYDQFPVSQAVPVGTHDFSGALNEIPTHNCNCGPDCNCLACPDHPYNDATTKHIQEVGRIIAQDTQTLDEDHNRKVSLGNGNYPNGPPLDEPFVDTGHHVNDGLGAIPAGQCCGNDAEGLDDDHDDYDDQTFDSFDADHLMVPDAYYTYEYQVGLPGACAGEVGNCQCGPSCSCLGCLTHGNPL
ncbi:hypothetical protein BJX61DRAFT_268091 [Aspergillus egyptiacus]|nr:hypothetical protein BJX61DRAFT_268091 [Aspergillus egyptiacus]